MEEVELNFVALEDQSQTFTVFSREVFDTNAEKEEGLYRTKLPLRPDEWVVCDVAFTDRDGFQKFECSYDLNAALSEQFLFGLLKSNLESHWNSFEYSFPRFSKYKEVIFKIEGKSTVEIQIVVHPYFFRAKKNLGFLLQSKFSLNEGVSFNRTVQIESLSLDKTGKPNIFMFRDKQALINRFLREAFIDFCSNSGLNVEATLKKAEVKELSPKSYVVGKAQSSLSQFGGIKQYGPYRNVNESVRYLFLFSEKTRSLGRDVYLGLAGKLFPAQFPGMDRMFGLDINKSLVDHYVIDDFNKTELDSFSEYLEGYQANNEGMKVMLIVALPKGFKGNESGFDAYGYLKLISLSRELYCQFAIEDTFYKKDLLKWSVSNIGLQVFSKLGGAPWLVKPAKNDCLILGLGSAHEVVNRVVQKWFAYTVCLDSSGDFKFIRPLSSSNDEISYIDSFKTSLKDIIVGQVDERYTSVVLHIPFKIKKKEIEAIKEVISSVKDQYNCELVVIRINTHHKYLGFSKHNTRVPYESSYLKLSYNTFLLWTEGLHHGKEVLHKRVSEPLLIDFMEGPDTWGDRKECLQDILNLTGANWRGFNSKAQPISILYSKLIADFMKEFSHLEGVDDLSIVEAEAVAPWFL